jgi:hypothetical protein
MNEKPHAGASPTQRSAVSLPLMPLESELAHRYPPIAMARARVVQAELVFEQPHGFAQALRQGFFLLQVPPRLDLLPGDLFVRHCFLPKARGKLASYTGFKHKPVPGAYQGYFDREHDQWENYYIERSHWQRIPPEVCELGQQMAAAGLCVLHSVLKYLHIPRDEWERLTCGLSEGRGHQMLGFNHFRSGKPTRGCKFHRDSGWVTILRSTEPGLIAYIDGDLHAIQPARGHFIVNFGSSIEVLSQNLPQKVHASIHGVVRTQRDDRTERFSYVLFLDSDLAGDIYTYDEAGGARRVQSVAEFAAQEVRRTYDNDDML